MKKTLIAILMMSLTFNLFAHIVPEFGYTSIQVEAVGHGQDAMISFKYCEQPSKPCELLGGRLFSVEEIKKQRKIERNQVLALYASTIPAAIAGAFLGANAEGALYTLIAGDSVGAVIPVFGMMAGFIAAGGAPIYFTENQRIQKKVLSLSSQDRVVENDKEVLRYKEQLEIVLAKVDGQSE